MNPKPETKPTVSRRDFVSRGRLFATGATAGWWQLRCRQPKVSTSRKAGFSTRSCCRVRTGRRPPCRDIALRTIARAVRGAGAHRSRGPSDRRPAEGRLDGGAGALAVACSPTTRRWRCRRGARLQPPSSRCRSTNPDSLPCSRSRRCMSQGGIAREGSRAEWVAERV